MLTMMLSHQPLIVNAQQASDNQTDDSLPPGICLILTFTLRLWYSLVRHVKLACRSGAPSGEKERKKKSG
jgi:hypothetical protein